MKTLIILFIFKLLFPVLVFSKECKVVNSNAKNSKEVNSCEDSKENFNLCFISLNNEKEYTTTKSFVEKLNKNGDVNKRVNVYEFQKKGDSPHDSFVRMVESGTVCNGLVISGHHTGAFGGHNASGSLELSFLEDLSCNPKYAQWFKGVSALWLQGCRTVGEKVVNRELAGDNLADFHARRVAAVANEDGLEQGQWQLNQEYSNLLDDTNPYSSRFLRVFPRANVFGWTATAPGVNARSELSISYHISNVARLLHRSDRSDDLKDIFDDPSGINMSVATMLGYQKALLSVLSPNQNDQCIPCITKAWVDHGNADKKKGKYGYANPDLEAYKALDVVGDPELIRAKELECILKEGTKEDKIKALKEILQSKKSIGLTFNSLTKFLTDHSSDKDLTSLLKGSEELSGFLKEKINSKSLSDVRRIDYYAFYKRLTGVKSEKIEEQLIARLLREIEKKDSDFNHRDFVQNFLDSMLKHSILPAKRALKIVNDLPSDREDLLGILFESIQKLPNAIDELNKHTDSSKQESFIRYSTTLRDSILEVEKLNRFDSYFKRALSDTSDSTDRDKIIKSLTLGSLVELSPEQNLLLQKTIENDKYEDSLSLIKAMSIVKFLPKEKSAKLLQGKKLELKAGYGMDYDINSLTADEVGLLSDHVSLSLSDIKDLFGTDQGTSEFVTNILVMKLLDKSGPEAIEIVKKSIEDLKQEESRFYYGNDFSNMLPELQGVMANKLLKVNDKFLKLEVLMWDSVGKDIKKRILKEAMTDEDPMVTANALLLGKHILSQKEYETHLSKLSNLDLKMTVNALAMNMDTKERGNYYPNYEGAKELISHANSDLYSLYGALMLNIGQKDKKLKQDIYKRIKDANYSVEELKAIQWVFHDLESNNFTDAEIDILSYTIKAGVELNAYFVNSIVNNKKLTTKDRKKIIREVMKIEYGSLVN